MSSPQRVAFESAVNTRNWPAACNNVSALAMPEMLAALEILDASYRSTLINNCPNYVVPDAAARVRSAAEVVLTWAIPTWLPPNLPPDQVQNARDYLVSHTQSIENRLAGLHVNDRTAIATAVRSGRILGVNNQLNSVARLGYFLDNSGRVLYLADPMYGALLGLANANVMTLMSLMRYHEGPHGRVQDDSSAEGSAMDISSYANIPINLIGGQNVDNAINGVAAVLRNLPAGEYALGLPRPSPYAKGPPMPQFDVFLTVDATHPMYMVGTIDQFRNENAKTAVRSALTSNPRARINRMFCDGPDHFHLEVIS
jgi:hypothetical protein